MPNAIENHGDANINDNDFDDMLENDASFDYYANFDGDGTKLPTVDQIMAFIEQMKDLNDTEREQLKANIMQQQAKANEKLSQYAATHSAILGGGGGGIAHTTNDYLIFTAMIILIITVFVLFGYKLYKSLVERQRKREEKLKAKQLKKKK